VCEIAGTARVTEILAGPSLVAVGLVRKRGVGAKRVRPLASRPLSRIGVSGCETVGEVDV